MKQKLFNRSINFLFLLIFSVACSKSVETKTAPPPPPPPPPPVPGIYFVSDGSWSKTSEGTYQSDLYQVLPKNAGPYSSIETVTVLSGANPNSVGGAVGQELVPGNTMQYDGGELTFTGSLLIFKAQLHYGQGGFLPFNAINLKITAL